MAIAKIFRIWLCRQCRRSWLCSIRLLFCFSALLAMNAGHAQEPERAEIIYEFRHGLWFNGRSFDNKIMYSVAGVFRTKKPFRMDSVVDLSSKHIVPPFGEAHNHLLDPNIGAYVRICLRDGVFYVKDQGSVPYLTTKFRNKLNQPASIDVVFANQPFTGPGGHPLEIVEYGLRAGLLPRGWGIEKLDGEAVFIISDLAELQNKWPHFLAGRPDFVKAMLLYSEDYDKRKNDPAYQYRKGLNPQLLPEIVKRAHEAGLRVSAHVCTAADFHHAVAAGVDEITHLPGAGFEKALGTAGFRISPEDAQLAAKNKTVVITTLRWLDKKEAKQEEGTEALKREVIFPNLRLLKSRGVIMVIGSDQYGQSSAPEALFLSTLGVFDNLELLKMWCEATPRQIFPHRKIGQLRDGYEASFLVLDGNPLEDFANTQKIVRRYKQERFISVQN